MKRLLVLVALVALLVVVFVAALPWWISSQAAKGVLAAIVHAATGFEVEVARLEIDADGALVARELLVRRPDGMPLLSARRAGVELSTSSLAERAVERVSLEGFRFSAGHGSQSDADEPSSGAVEDALPRRLPFRLLELEDGIVEAGAGDPAGLRVVRATLSFRQAGDELTSAGRAEPIGSSGVVVWDGRLDLAARSIDAALDCELDDAAELLAVLGLGGPAAVVDDATVKGSLKIRGTVNEDLEVGYALNGRGGSLPGDLDLRGRASTSDGILTLQSTSLIGPSSAPLSLAGRIDAGAGWAEAVIDLQLDWERAELAELSTLLETVDAVPRIAGELSVDLNIRGTAESPVASGRVTVDGLELSRGELEASADLALELTYRDGDIESVERGLRVSRLRMTHGGAEAEVGELEATVSLAIPIAPNSNGAGRLRIDDLQARGVSFHGPEYRRLAEGVVVKGDARLEVGDGGIAKLEASATMDEGEALWDRLYVSLEEQPLEVGIAVDLSANHVLVRRARLDARGLFNLTADGRLDSAWRPEVIEVELDVPQLEPAFDALVKEPLSVTYPRLDRTRVGGRLSGRVNARFDAGALGALRGELAIGDGELEVTREGEGRDTLLRGIDLVLPVMIGGDTDRGRSGTGRLSLAPSELVGVAVSGFSVPLIVSADRIGAQRDIVLEMAGGTVSIDGFVADSLSTERRAARFGLTLDALELAPVLAAAALPEFSGRIDGRLERIEASRTAIVSQGEVKAAVFGGSVIAGGLRVEQLSTPVPSLHLDVRVQDIDLQKVTEATALGEIRGVLSGAIGGLEIVAGQPVAFDATLETTGGRGGKQRISVKALEQLQILGGAGGSGLTRGLLGFFDEYRYAKMGVRCSLRRDLFVLNGVETLDGKDFLVVGSFWPPTVNVVSHNQEIVFSEMVERLSRIAAVGGEQQP